MTGAGEIVLENVVMSAEERAAEWRTHAYELRSLAATMESQAKSMRRRADRALEQARLLSGQPKPTPIVGGTQDRILWNRGRDTIDEIVIHDCMVHVEQMDDNCWWIGIYKEADQDQMWTGNFYCPHHRSKTGMSFTEQDCDIEWDRDEEHR